LARAVHLIYLELSKVHNCQLDVHSTSDVSGYRNRINCSSSCSLTLEYEGITLLRNMETTNPVSQRHIPEDLTPQFTS